MIKVFFSYSHKDRDLRDELDEHLAPLKKQQIISTWHDCEIIAGQDWQQRIDEELEQADLILLLISPSFLDSEHCYDREMTRALARHESGDAMVIPVILRPCLWRKTNLAQALCVPTNGTAVTDYDNRDKALYQAAEAIAKAVEDLEVVNSSRKFGLPPLVEDQGDGYCDHWLIKTFNRTKQVGQLREQLFKPNQASIVVVDGCKEDLPEYLAHHTFLDLSFDLDEDIPRKATTLRIADCGSGAEAFWRAVFRSERLQTNAERDIALQKTAVRTWLAGQDNRVFYLPLQIETEGLRVLQIVRDAQAFLKELINDNTMESSSRLLILIGCKAPRRLPWWWLLWYLWCKKRFQGIICLGRLEKLKITDIDEWFDRFEQLIQTYLRADQLRAPLEQLFSNGTVAIRYDQVRDCLIKGQIIQRARLHR